MPPVYPTLVRITPAILPNQESGPQNQPSANVAVFTVDGIFISICGTSLCIVPTDLFMVFLPSYPWVVKCCPATITRDIVKKIIVTKSLIPRLFLYNRTVSIPPFACTPLLFKETTVFTVSLFFQLFLWNKTESG